MALLGSPKPLTVLPRKVGRQAQEEVSSLAAGMDFRLPQYRREVFLRFYEFHLRYRSHPGCVYYAMPWLSKMHQLDAEQRLWVAFLNGNTQNIVTTWEIFKRFPSCSLKVAEGKLRSWFDDNYTKLAWDTDRRYHKKDFIKSVAVYAELVGSSQQRYFNNVSGSSEGARFLNLWEKLRSDFYTFGRLSSFSYAEYLRIMGVLIDCPTLFLRDMSGSKSHRNGLAKVLGRDDLDWFRETSFEGDYTEEELCWLEGEAQTLLEEARARVANIKKIDSREVSFFTLESALCTYKSWHRLNRRYANCYNDMFYERIKRAESEWGEEAVSQFWDCREDCTPKHLLLEWCPNDPGLVPYKQNWYRSTGQPIMMSRDWPEFDNQFDRAAWAGVGTRRS